MSLAILITLSRRPARIIIGYLITAFLLLLTLVVHPDNTPFVISQGTRFLLPVVLPSFLCLTTVYNYDTFEKTLYYVSWATMALVLLYVFGFFTGIVSISSYNMAFSFACVLPFVVFYSHRRYYDWIACLLLFVVVIAIGARGPALCMLVYVIIDMFQHKSKWRVLVLVIGVAFMVLLPLFMNWLDTIGISSRTLNMLMAGNIISETGRSGIRQHFYEELLNHPVLGIGFFGDRLYGETAYCHNILLEIVLDFGILVGGGLLITGIIVLISIYKKSDSEKKSMIIKYFCAFLLPFMTSGSYLIDSGLAIFCGLCYLYNKEGN